MKREFKYDKKESYSQADMDKIISENTSFVAGGYDDYVSKEDHNAALKPYKQAERKKYISGLAKDLVNPNGLSDAIALSGITEDDDDKSILEKIKNTVSTRDYLKVELPPEFQKEKKISAKQPEKENEGSKQDFSIY